MAGVHVVIADDEHDARNDLAEQVAALGHQAHPVPSGPQALRLLDDGIGDVLLLDLVMPDMDGFAVLDRMRLRRLPVPAIAMTHTAGADGAAAAVHAGAVDFVLKPVCNARLKVAVGNALRLSALETEIDRMGRRERRAAPDLGLASRSPAMRRALRSLFRSDHRDLPVLLEGEVGTGKETLARAIHATNRRRTGAFVTLDNRRSVDDACKDAAGGTLFVPTIETLGTSHQEALADRLDTATSHGDGRTAARLIATSHVRLFELVAERRFCDRLFNRLNVLPVWIPPLRERREDLPALCRALLARQVAAPGGQRVRTIEPEALSRLADHPWHGNLWELETVLAGAAASCRTTELRVCDLDEVLWRQGHDEQKYAWFAQNNWCGDPQSPNAEGLYGIARILGEQGQLRTMDALEKETIGFALEYCHGRVSEVARGLGIGRSTLYRKLKEYGLAARAAE